VRNDRKLFEFLILEARRPGFRGTTILAKRANSGAPFTGSMLTELLFMGQRSQAAARGFSIVPTGEDVPPSPTARASP